MKTKETHNKSITDFLSVHFNSQCFKLKNGHLSRHHLNMQYAIDKYTSANFFNQKVNFYLYQRYQDFIISSRNTVTKQKINFGLKL